MGENYVIVTAQQKIGKTQLSDFLYVYQVVDYLFEHRDDPDVIIDANIIYFSLEMSIKAKMRQAMAYRLFSKYKISVSPQKLRSIFKNYVVDNKILNLIKAEEEWFKFFESKVTFHDSVRNPQGIFNTVKNYFEINGTYTYKIMDWIDDNNNVTKRKVKDQYISNNPNKINIILTDHISLLSPEARDAGSLQKAISRFSSEMCLHFRDKWKACVVNVQQQAAAGEQQQYTNTGTSIVDKLKPSADSLGDHKATARDINLMIGLFGPHRYGFKAYNRYNLERLEDNYRELSILLNRDGISNAAIGLFFNGASNFFTELPRVEDMTEADYSRVETLRSQII